MGLGTEARMRALAALLGMLIILLIGTSGLAHAATAGDAGDVQAASTAGAAAIAGGIAESGIAAGPQAATQPDNAAADPEPGKDGAASPADNAAAGDEPPQGAAAPAPASPQGAEGARPAGTSPYPEESSGASGDATASAGTAESGTVPAGAAAGTIEEDSAPKSEADAGAGVSKAADAAASAKTDAAATASRNDVKASTSATPASPKNAKAAASTASSASTQKAAKAAAAKPAATPPKAGAATLKTQTTARAAAGASTGAAKATTKATEKTPPPKATAKAKATAAVSTQSRKPILKAGSYIFVAGTARGKVLDVSGASTKAGANVIIWDYNGGKNQVWTISYDSGGYAKLTGIGGRVLQVSGSKARNGLNVCMGKPANSSAQKWLITRNADGSYRIVSALGSKYALDIAGASGKSGANVDIRSNGTAKAQSWLLQALKPDIPATGKVADGWYTLKSALDTSYCLDVTGADSSNGTPLELWRKNATTAQAYRVYRSGKYYRIESGTGAGANLDVEAGAVVPGTKAEVWKSKTDCALFSFQRNADGSYRLVNVASGLALAVTSGKAAQGARVTAELSKAGAKAQSFFLVKRPGLLEEGVYSVRSSMAGSRAIGPKGASTARGAAIATGAYSDDFHQKWQVKAVAGKTNTYTLESIATGYKLQGAPRKASTQQAASSAKAQQWIPAGVGGHYVLKNAATGMLLDVSGASGANGAAVITWQANGGANQKWSISPAAPLKSGIYEFRSAANAGNALDVEGASEAEGANVEVWKRNGGANQRWYYSASDGTLVSMCSGKALDIEGASRRSGANVLQWSLTGGKNQKWKVSYAGGGKFLVSSALGTAKSPLVLTAAGNAAGKNVTSSSLVQGRQSQLWKPVKHDLVLAASLKKSLAGVDLKNARGVGIDVSAWNGNINWAAVKNAGVDFAIIRAGHGTGITDEQFASNIRGCRSVGMGYGVYYYSTARNVAQANAEAKHALGILRKAGVAPSDMKQAVYYDLEEEALEKASNRKLFASMANAFLGTMKGNGYRCGVYANLNWWNNYLTDPAFNRYERWVAQWRVGACGYKGDYKLWQCTSDGSVPGISGRVDIDIRY